MSSAFLVVPLILVALFKHSELAVYSFCNLVCVFQKCVPCHVKVFNIMWEYHVQLQRLTHFKLFMKFQEIFPHFGNHSFNSVEVQCVAVYQCVQKIDVPKVIDKEIVIFRNISAKYSIKETLPVAWFANMWLFRFSFLVNDFSHSGQWLCLSVLWNKSMCRRIFCGLLNILLHFSHSVAVFSLLCTNLCLLRLLLRSVT